MYNQIENYCLGNQRLKAAFMKIDLIKPDYNPKLCDGKYKYNIDIYTSENLEFQSTVWLES